MANSILFFGCILLVLFLGVKLKINIGFIALAFAFLIGTTAGGMSAGAVVNLFPVTLFFNFFIATFLFAFASQNGTLKKLAEHLIYACRNAGWLLGILFFLVTALVAGLGAGGAAPFFMSAICFSLAIQAGISPLLVPIAMWTGPMVGASFAWTSGYATNVGQLEIYYDTATASGYVVSFFAFRAVYYTILYLVMFVILKGYRVNKTNISMAKPEPLDEAQKKTLAIILGIIVMIVIPAFVQLIAPNPITKWLTAKCSFQFLASIGIVLNILWKTAPYDQVIKKHVPWDTLLMLSLTGMYMALAKNLGIIDYMSETLQNSVPAVMIIPGIVLIMSVLSFFVSGGVIIPMMLPLLSVLSAASGASTGAIYAATQMGLTSSSISPFSQGGAAALTGCTDEAIRKKLVKQQTILSGVFSAVLLVVSALGAFSIL
ncbi:MAG: hypothetical protein IKQ69_02725 [Oscillospiraceae bacterium]|nr:hypothetical protein [Oscillospiraceae bacterium]